MGFFSGIRRTLHRFALGLDDPKAWDESLWRLRGSQSESGETVDEYSALTYSAVWNAVTLISGTIASLPLNLYSRRNGKTLLQDGLSVHHLLHYEANPLLTALAFRECQMAHVLLWGNAYAEIVRNGIGDIVELWPITPNRVKPVWDKAASTVAYEIDMGKDEEKIVLPREKVLHIAGLGFDGFRGYSVVAQANRSIGLGMALESFGSKYFGEGTHPGMVVQHPGKLTDEGHQHLRDSMANTYSGLGKAHRLMLLEEGMTFAKVAIAPEEAQFLESRQFQIPEVARWFNLPPHKLKDLTRSSFSNIESEQISFVTDSILPWLVRLEQHYHQQLLTPLQKRRLYFKHRVEGLMRGSSTDRANFYARMWGIGAMSINDILEKEDSDPVAGGGERFVPANMIPLSRALKEPQPEPEPPADLETEPEPAPPNGEPPREDVFLVPVLPRDPQRIFQHATTQS